MLYLDVGVEISNKYFILGKKKISNIVLYCLVILFFLSLGFCMEKLRYIYKV